MLCGGEAWFLYPLPAAKILKWVEIALTVFGGIVPQEIGVGSVNAPVIVALRAIFIHANIMREMTTLLCCQNNPRNHQILIITTGDFHDSQTN